MAQVGSTTLPTGGQVSAGSASINQSGARMNVNQGTSKAIINWQTFDVGSQAQVNFQQPNAAAMALVLSAAPSQIYGKMTANGQVYLINPSGITFGAGAQVDVGGLVASTLNIKDSDLLSGNYAFTRDGSTGATVNQGTLTSAPGGYIGLLAPEVRNEGGVTARLGTVALAAGDKVTLNFTGNGNINIEVDLGTVHTPIENHDLIAAPDGRVIMPAKAATVLLGGVINNSGVIEADSLTSNGGAVRLEASNAINDSGSISANAGTSGNGGTVSLISGGTTTISGPITARGGTTSGNGGFVEISGQALDVTGTTVDTTAPHGMTGTWLLDPFDLTVVKGSGGSFTSGPGNTTVGNQTINSALATTNVTLQAGGSAGDGQGNGDINVNAPIAWSSGNALALNAFHDINVNANVTPSGTAGALSLDANGGAAGGLLTVATGSAVTLNGNAALTIGGAPYTLVTDPTGLQNINADLSGHYALANDVDLTGINNFTPLGNGTTMFSGAFEGLGHSISRLTINQPAGSDIGLFGNASGSISNVHLNRVDITGISSVGGLAGGSSGRIYNASADGRVSGGDSSQGVGGLVGTYNRSSRPVSIDHSSAAVDVTVGSHATAIGGLIGTANTGFSQVIISSDSASGTVRTGNDSAQIGGLIGFNINAFGPLSLSGNSATSDVLVGDRATDIGGLIGTFAIFTGGGTISGASASGSVRAGDNSSNVGGLIGSNVTGESTSNVRSSTAFGSVITGNNSQNVGALVGRNAVTSRGTIAGIFDSQAAGTLRTGSDSTNIGGLVGQNAVTPIAQGRARALLQDSSSSGRVTTGDRANAVGGLVGLNDTTAEIQGSSSSGREMTGDNSNAVGGLVGFDNAGQIVNSTADGDVQVGRNSANIGSLVGRFVPGNIQGSTGAGHVIAGPGSTDVGGQIGGSQ